MHKDIKPDQIVVGLGWVLMANKFRHQGLGVGANATRTSPPDIGWKRPSTILGPPSWSVYSHKIPHISGGTGSVWARECRVRVGALVGMAPARRAG